jgi:hypothetical protein
MTMVSAVLKCIIFWHSLTVIHRRTTGFLYLYFLSVACTLLLQDHECAYLDSGKVHVMQNWISSTSLLQVGHATYRVPYLNLICVHRPHRRVLEAKAKGKSQKCYWSLFIPTTLCWAVNIYHSELNCGVSQKSIFFCSLRAEDAPSLAHPLASRPARQADRMRCDEVRNIIHKFTWYCKLLFVAPFFLNSPFFIWLSCRM